ncbi:hypothetical protein GOBAR_DD22955 [Gossypium barbadense]|nr:hypothetical protein GOBAR_DD22955 [Gossypium barbadense]
MGSLLQMENVRGSAVSASIAAENTLWAMANFGPIGSNDFGPRAIIGYYKNIAHKDCRWTEDLNSIKSMSKRKRKEQVSHMPSNI